MKKSTTKKYLCIGVGGRRCPCCFPAPGNRKEVYRSAKRKEKAEAFKIEQQDLENSD